MKVFLKSKLELTIAILLYGWTIHQQTIIDKDQMTIIGRVVEAVLNYPFRLMGVLVVLPLIPFALLMFKLPKEL